MIVLSEQTVRAINIAVLSFCSLELIILLLSFPRFRLKNRASGIFYAKMLVSAFMMLCYAVSFAHGYEKTDALNVVMRALAYAGIYAVCILYIMYIRECVNDAAGNKAVSESIIYISIVVGSVGTLLWILSIFTPVFHELGDPSLKFGGQFILSHAGGMILLTISVLLLFAYKSVLGGREFAVLMSMPLLLVLATVFEPLAQGIELRYPSVVLEFLIVYTQHNLELENRQEMKDTESLKQRLVIAADRMKPHYLYNILTTIYYLIDSDPARAQHAVGTFSEYMRSTLEAMENQELVDFKWELHEIRNYLVLEKIRYGDKLNVVYDIEYEDFLLPPLSIQPFVENAVMHGIGNTEKGGTIRIISRKLSDGGAQIRIKDDGAGFDIENIAEDDVVGAGIANVRMRLQREIGGDVTITSAPGKGTTVMVTIRKA